MRDLTRADLEAFFRWIRKHGPPPEGYAEQSLLIGRALHELGVMRTMCARVDEGRRLGLSASACILSLVTAAFQMGREFEGQFLRPPKCAERSTQKQRSSPGGGA